MKSHNPKILIELRRKPTIQKMIRKT